MGLLFESLLADAMAAWCAFVGLLYIYVTATFDYWRVRGVKFSKPIPLFGNVLDMTLLRTSVAEGFQEMYNAFPGEPFVGLFQARSPTLLLRDPQVIRSILVRDFDFFQGRGVPFDAARDPLSAHLLNLEGAPWRKVRRALSPAFTPAKLRAMFPLMAHCATDMAGALTQEAEVDVKEAMARFTTDVIGACAFGLHFNALKEPDCPFRRMGQKMFRPSARPVLRRFVRLLVPAGLFKALNIRLIPRALTDFFVTTVKEAMARRCKERTRRPDFLQALVDIKMKGAVEAEAEEEEGRLRPLPDDDDDDDFALTDAVLAAQAFAFLLAGFETTSTTMAFCLLELAAQPSLLHRARHEAEEVLRRRGRLFDYEAMEEMRFLDCAIAETLRKYPPSANLVRVVSKPYTLEDTGVKLDAGVRVVVPVYALHHDPAYWPDPERFDPSRFANGTTHAPFTYLPFGEGPRVCIGQRFGLLQAKVGLALLLTCFDFAPTVRSSLPIRLDPATLVTNAVGSVWLRMRRRRRQHKPSPPTTPVPA